MSALRFVFGVALAVLLALQPGAMAQTVEEEPRETIKIGLSSDTIEIATDFTGTDLTIFGSLDNPRIETLRGGGYDVIVVLEGPARRITVREKKRILGIWMNADALTFRDVPKSYLLASTRTLRDIASDKAFSQLSLGVEARYLPPAFETTPEARAKRFGDAFRQLQGEAGLYAEDEASLRFISQNLFKATLSLPSSIPLGTHRARAFLFRDGQFLAEDSSPLFVTKDSLEQTIYVAAHKHSLLYGLGAVLLAMLTGWLGRLMFRND